MIRTLGGLSCRPKQKQTNKQAKSSRLRDVVENRACETIRLTFWWAVFSFETLFARWRAGGHANTCQPSLTFPQAHVSLVCYSDPRWWTCEQEGTALSKMKATKRTAYMFLIFIKFSLATKIFTDLSDYGVDEKTDRPIIGTLVVTDFVVNSPLRALSARACYQWAGL